MNQPSSLESLTDAQQSRVREIAAQFAQAWRSRQDVSEDISLAEFLPPPEDPLRVAVLLQLIPTDLEQRRGRGEKLLLEHYLQHYPELGDSQSLPVELICCEYRIRRVQGDPLRIESYRHRFPAQFAALVELVGGRKSSLPAAADSSIPSSAGSSFPGPASSPQSSPVPGWVGGTMSPGDPAVAAAVRKVMPVGEGYQLLACIGRGVFGEVWKAEAPGGVEVAVKVIHRTAGDQLTQVELRALELMKRLRHPFLLQVQAYWVSGEQLHIVMDLADKTLLERLEECRRDGLPGIPPEELLAYMREAAEALDFLHGNRVLHRDVKPANILLAKGHARLADFGLARLFMKAGIDIRATTIGTPLYMGPEVWEHKVGPESDQYSLAATYIELRLGRPLFDAESQEEVRLNHLGSDPDLKGLPAPERRVMQKALAKKLSERFRSCTEFVDELRIAVLGPSLAAKPWISRRTALLVMFLGAGSCAAAAEVTRRLHVWPWTLFGLEVTAPSSLALRAGEEEPFEIHLLGAEDPDQATLSFSGVPDGVKLNVQKETAAEAEASEEGAATGIWRIRAAADLNMPEANFGQEQDVTLQVTAGTLTAERTIKLTVAAPTMALPPDCEPAVGAVKLRVPAEGANYWNRIVRKLPAVATLPSGKQCEFVLIPYNPVLKLPSFYMLVNKVWNELFAEFNKQFLSSKPEEADKEDWPDDWQVRGAALGAKDMPAEKHPLNPVMSVGFWQAQEFAKWLGGALPSCEQWDTASGLHLPDAEKRQGPFEGEWKDSAGTLDIAVNREGTLPITEADDDFSPLGCRHMAGNGWEWTRDTDGGQLAQVKLRGRRYDVQRPLLYKDLLDKTRQSEIGSEDANVTSPYIGFRMVIEPQHPTTKAPGSAE